MKFVKWEIEIPEFTVDEWEGFSEETQKRVQELRKKISQYRGMLNTLKKHNDNDKITRID